MGRKKSQTVGYHYYLGMHLVFAHGPIDRLLKILAGPDQRTVFEGSNTGGSITVSKFGLFGGDDREGGVGGVVDFEQGGPAQTANTYLVAQQGANIPAYRGVCALVFRRFYHGNSAYLKPYSIVAQRVHTAQDGAAQWYDAKAGIPVSALSVTVGYEDNFADGLTPYSGDTSFFSANGGYGFGAVIQGLPNVSSGDKLMSRTIPTTSGTFFEVYFRLIDVGNSNDSNVLVLRSGVTQRIVVNPIRETAFDIQRKPFITYAGETIAMHTSQLSAGVNYKVAVNIVPGAGNSTAVLTNVDTAVIVHTSTFAGDLSSVSVNDIQFQSSSGINRTAWSKLRLFDTSGAEDMNPAHIVRECLTNQDWGMGYATAEIDDVAFTACADTLFTEGFGLSLVWDKQMPIEDFIKEVLRHIDGSIYVDRKTGKFVLKLIRDDYVEASLPVLDESNIEQVQDFSRRGFDELYNSVTVNFEDNSTHRPGSVEVQDIAQIQTQGTIINTTATYAGIGNAALAARVASRDLKSLSIPLATATIYVAPTDTVLAFNIGSAFKFSWADYDVQNIVMRVVGISFGDGVNNTVRIQATQDAFAIPTAAFIVTDPGAWVDINLDPVPASYQQAIEVPYYEIVQDQGQSEADAIFATNDLAGFVAAFAVRPAGAINALIATDAGAGYQEISTPLQFCPSATIVTELTESTVSVTLENDSSLSNVVAGSYAQIDNELIVVTSIVSLVLTFKRGTLDTVPARHVAGSRIFFWSSFNGRDPAEYNSAETVNVKIMPVTGKGQLDVTDAVALPVTLNRRAFRPYPPGDYKVNGSYYPPIVLTVAITLTWTHRDRTQQTAGDLVSFLDGSIGPEAGTTYNVYLYDNVSGTLLETATGITGLTWTSSIAGSFTIRAEVESQRAGLVSYQRQSAIFEFVDGRLLEDQASTELRVFEDGVILALE